MLTYADVCEEARARITTLGEPYKLEVLVC
jgi:hypothetical protein